MEVEEDEKDKEDMDEEEDKSEDVECTNSHPSSPLSSLLPPSPRVRETPEFISRKEVEDEVKNARLLVDGSIAFLKLASHIVGRHRPLCLP